MYHCLTLNKLQQLHRQMPRASVQVKKQQQCEREANSETIMCTQQALCTQYTKNNVVAINFSRKREHVHSTSTTFVWLLCKTIKSQDKTDDGQ